MALAELGGRIAVELEREGEGSFGVRQHRAVAGGSGGDLGDPTHADRVMVAAGEECLTSRRAEGRRVKARVPQPAGRELLELRRVAWPSEGAACPEADVIDEDHEHVGRVFGWPNIADRRELRVRILRVVRRRANVLDIRDGQAGSGDVVA